MESKDSQESAGSNGNRTEAEQKQNSNIPFSCSLPASEPPAEITEQRSVRTTVLRSQPKQPHITSAADHLRIKCQIKRQKKDLKGI